MMDKQYQLGESMILKGDEWFCGIPGIIQEPRGNNDYVVRISRDELFKHGYYRDDMFILANHDDIEITGYPLHKYRLVRKWD